MPADTPQPIPGPGDRPPLDQLSTLRDGPHAFLLRIAQEYGPILRYPVGPPVGPRFAFYLVCDPDGVKHVLQDNHKNYSKDTFQYNLLSSITGQGLLTSDGDFWLRQRRLAQPAFHKTRVAGFGPVMLDAAQAMLARWDAHAAAGEPIDVAEEMMHVALQIVGKALFSAEIGGQADALAQATLTVLDHIVHRARTFGIVPEWLPTRGNRRHKAAMRTLEGAVYETIAARRPTPPAPLPASVPTPPTPLPARVPTPPTPLPARVPTPPAPLPAREGGALETPFYRLALNAHGQLISLYDKRHGREVLAPGGRGNVFQAFEDKPMKFDAWDVDIYYQEKMVEVTDLAEAMVEETGPLRHSLRLAWRFRDSTIIQRLTLYAGSPRIDFRTEVDWHERQTLLKVAFPVDIRATRATYDIQFGAVERPTHWNTSWDWARFEVPAHKWADLSEGNYGVALLNDCKYGYDIRDHVMRLTLIKSAIRPDAQADQGRHVFTYSLLPHAGDWRQGNVMKEAYALNYPLLAAPSHGMAVSSDFGHPERRPRSPWPESKDAASHITAAHPPATVGQPLPTSALGASRFSFASVDADNVIIETVKRAEDDPDAWIIRLYEYQQSRRRGVRLTLCRPLRRAVACNLVEQDEQPIAFDPAGITFDILPFEIKTFKVWFE